MAGGAILRLLEAIPEDVYVAVIEFAVAGLNAYVVYGIYKTCQSAETILNVLRDAPYLSAGNELAAAAKNTENETLPYVAVRGKVQEIDGQAIAPSRNGVTSVIRKTDHQEIRSKYSWNGSRYTFAGKGYETIEFRPFCLTPVSECPISINFQAQSVSYGSHGGETDPIKNFPVRSGSPSESSVLLIKDISLPSTTELLQTFPTYFEKSDRKESRVSEFFDYIFGIAAVSGIQKTEHLLPINEVVTALGRITKTADGQFTLTAPSVPNALYMLTTRPLEDIIEEYSIRVSVGSALIFLLSCGGAFLLYDAVKRLKTYYDIMYPRDLYSIDDVSSSSCDNLQAQNETPSSPESQVCIICQERPRNVVLLNCRHFCTCENCSRRLNGNCPVCRQRVQDYFRVFVS